MCPTINKLPKKPQQQQRPVSDAKSIRAIAYNSAQWRKMRDTYMHEHPICEDCLKKGKVTPATDIHHIRSPFRGGEINWTLLLDYNNLMSLCKECHGLRHAKQQGHITPEEVIAQLDALFDNSISDEELEGDDHQ